MDESPLVSICIPTFNRANMVGKAIDSVLSQSYSNMEIIVVDNSSHDDIESVIAGYNNSILERKIKFYKNERNLGLFGNFNKCIEHATGKYIHILHSDDYIDPDFTQTCVNFLESHPNVGMTFTSSQVTCNGSQKKIGVSDNNIIFPTPEGFKKILETKNLICCPSVMMRREVYNSVGFYSLEYPYSGDYYQWLKIAQRFDIAYIAKATLFYREGEHSESFRLIYKKPLGYIDTIKILVQITDDLGTDVSVYRRELNIACRRHMKDCLYSGIMLSYLMESFSPLIFIGFSINAWSLIQTESILDKLKKCAEFFIILTFGVSMVIPGGLYCLRKIFTLKQQIR
jgi:hypothetical protein